MGRIGRKLTTRAGTKKKRRIRLAAACHYNVYVVYLRNPKGDGKAGYYVGMTGLSPEKRFENHKKGVKAAAASSSSAGTEERDGARFSCRIAPKNAEKGPRPN